MVRLARYRRRRWSISVASAVATVLSADKRFIGRRQELAALDGALDAVKGLGSLASLGDLASLSNPLTPLTDAASSFGKIGSAVGDALGELGGLLK
jgi:hypothetical protein